MLARPTRLALLAYLATQIDAGPLQRDVVLGLFWPDATQENARNSLRQALHVIRRALGDYALLNIGTGVQLNESVVTCDVITLEPCAASRR